MSDSDFNDELIGAYLDGELSDRERQRVEQLLAEHAHCRRTLQELRALRDNLQSLPSHALGPDFGRRVLGEVQRQTQDQSAASSEDKAGDSSDSASDQGAMVAKPAVNWRSAAWAVAALAAAVLIMVFVPRNLNDLAVVQGPENRDGQHFDNDRFGRENLAEAPEGDAPRDSLAAASEASRPTGAIDSAGGALSGAGEPDSSLADFSDRTETLALDQSDPSSSFSPIIASAMRATESDVLVHVQVAQAATGTEAFDRSLGQNRIYYSRGRTEADGRLGARVESEAITEFDRTLGENLAKAYSDAATPSPAEPLELVYVEATVPQLHATLDELKAQRSQFPQVDLYQVAGWGVASANRPTPPSVAATRRSAALLGQSKTATSVRSPSEQTALFSEDLQRQGVPVQVIDDIYDAQAPGVEPAVDGADKQQAVVSGDEGQTERARARGEKERKTELGRSDEVAQEPMGQRSLRRLESGAFRYAPEDRDQAPGAPASAGVARRLELREVLPQTRFNPLRQQTDTRAWSAEAAPENELKRAEAEELRLEIRSAEQSAQAGRGVTAAATQPGQVAAGQRRLRVLFVISPQTRHAAAERPETRSDTSASQADQP